MTKDNKPTIGVVVTVFNQAGFLRAAVDSILAQSYAPEQIVVVDDGSDDDPQSITDCYPELNFLRQENQGQSAGRNFGASKIDTDLLAFLDGDDLWTTHKLRRQVDLLLRENLDAVFSLADEFVAEGADTNVRLRLRAPAHVTSAMLICRQAFCRVGGFDPKIRFAEFIDWYARAQDVGLKFGIVQEALLKRRVHSANMTGAHNSSKADYTRILKACLDRRRQTIASPQ
jgi:glycosyltransferase involved in cell wall biosynthesis